MRRVLSAVLVTTFLATVPELQSAHFSSWSNPVQLPAPINSPYQETGPALSKNGLSLYWTSTRPCGEGDTDFDPNIWVATRATTESDWGEPQCLEINAPGYEDSAPAFSRDEHWMYFVSNRPGSFGPVGTPNGRDIWVSWRSNVHDDHGWTDPVNAGSMINSAVADAGPSYFENDELGSPQLFFTSNRPGTFDIYVCDVVGQTFGTPRLVDELNGPIADARPAIRHDGLEIIFFRGILSSSYDLYSAVRASVTDAWSPPEPVAEINTESVDWQPFISSDEETLLFSSDRAIAGDTDIWMATRTKVPGKN